MYVQPKYLPQIYNDYSPAKQIVGGLVAPMDLPASPDHNRSNIFQCFRSTICQIMVLKLYVVVDPRHYHDSIESTLNATDWVEVELESAWVRMALGCRGRKGFIFQIFDREGCTNKMWVRIQDSVSAHIMYYG